MPIGKEPTRYYDVEVEKCLKVDQDLAVVGNAAVTGNGTYGGTLGVTGAFTATGGVTMPKAPVMTVTALTKSDNYALAAAEKSPVVTCTMSAGSKTLTLGLATGQQAVIKNSGGTNAFTVKNQAADTGTSLAAGKSMLFIASTTTDGNIVIALD